MGGSAKSSSAAVANPDTINQTDQIEVILGIASGPIKGLANGLKSFYVGDTQYQNDDGSFNFSLFDLEVYPGHADGEIITPIIGGYEDYFLNEHALAQNVPVTFETNKVSGVTQVILRIRILSLHKTGADAQLSSILGSADVRSFNPFTPATMQLDIMFRKTGTADWTRPFTQPFEITAKTITPEWHEVRFLTPIDGQIDVWMNNLTANDPVNAPCDVQLDGHYEVSGGVFGLTRSTPVGVTLAPGVQVVRTTDFPNILPDGTYGIDYINVRMSIPQLYSVSSAGTFPSLVQWSIESKPSSQATWTMQFGGPVQMEGQITKANGFDFRFQVPRTEDTYDVRVTRLTVLDPSQFQTLVWDQMEEIVGGPVKFDNVAVAHLVGTASNQFTSIPDFWGIYDLKLVRIPSNYDPYARTYSGQWDGTFKVDWTSNPAWCLYDLGMSEVYGLRRFWKVFTLDKWDTYMAGMWCDAPVPDGQGGVQPRYTFNGVIAEPRSAREQLRFMAGCFNGGFLDSSDGVTRLVYDHDEPASAVFTPENVGVDGFSYSYTDITTRFNDVTVKFNNPDLNFQVDARQHIDPDQVARYGSNPTEVAGIGCTSPHEASRRAAYKLITATTEKEIVSFTTNRQGLLLQPFSVILVSDPVMGNGLTGRIKQLDAYRETVTLRDPIFLELGVQYVFRTHATNPAYPASSTDPLSLVEVPFYAPMQGETYAFQLSSPLPVGVFENAQFSLGSIGNQIGVPKPYRITKIEESDGNADAIMIEAIEINRQKWVLADNVSGNINLDYINFPADVAAPTGLQVSTQKVNINGAILANVTFTWIAPNDARVNLYNVQYRASGDVGGWIDLGSTPRERIDLYNIADGNYDFQVQAVAAHGRLSLWAMILGVHAGLNVPPDDVQNVTLTLLGDSLYVGWSAVKALDLSYYWLKFSPLFPPDATWEGATDLLPQALSLHATVPGQTGTYFVKAVNVGGIESTNAGYATTTTQTLSHIELVKIYESPLFPSTASGNYNVIRESNFLKVADLAVANYGVYFWYSPDLQQVLTARISMEIVLDAELTNIHLRDWLRLSDVRSLSGVVSGDYHATIQIATSQDTLTFGPFIPFGTGDYKGRQFCYRIDVFSDKPHARPLIRSLATILKVPARSVTGKNVFVPTQSLPIVISPPFKTVPVFTVTAKAAVSGDYFLLTDEGLFGFTVQFFNSSNVAVGRFIDWQAFGFGGQ